MVGSCGVAADKGEVFEGTISATLTRAGTDTTHFLFTRKGNQLRIENVDHIRPEPINIVDLDAKKLTIVFPHNSSFVHLDLNKAPEQPGMPNNPASAGMGMPGNPGMGTGGMPSMPMMPAIPPIPGMFGAAELKKTDKTKKIQGFDCTLYTISQRGENFEIWATNDSSLFPYRALQRNYDTRHFGPPMLEEQWIELLQNKSLFPLEASLKMDPGGQERLSFKIDKIEKKKIDDEKLFQPPEKYIEIQAPQF